MKKRLIILISFIFLIYSLTLIFVYSGFNKREYLSKKFFRTYSLTKVQDRTKWLGVSIVQNPCDMWALQELICEVKPDFIIETGTLFGGSSIFFAHVLQDINENGKVITVDIVDNAKEASNVKLWQDRVEFILGDSVSREVIDKIAERIKGAERVLVTLDSDHHMSHVLRELRLYSRFVTVGSYLIVQDTSLDIWGKGKEYWNNGPMTAIKRFLEFNDNFEIDRSWEKFLLTWHPKGYLKRIKSKLVT